MRKIEQGGEDKGRSKEGGKRVRNIGRRDKEREDRQRQTEKWKEKDK